MSVQKLVAEADKFFDKGKVAEGIAKLKMALTAEPLNQLVATKLATVFVQNKDPLEAAKVYGSLAKRLSDAGKSSVAIAIYKQALELSPDDILLRLRYAIECEAIGKLGDAFLQGQVVLNYYLRRKKFFDASNVLPLMARAQPKDEKVKIAWIEVMQLCQAEQKLVNLLVALCGPPGVASPDFPVGGDPATLSPALYDGLKRLVPFFPRDPKIAYAVAWCAYRRGVREDAMHFLHECLRREPDFCLAILLFARMLAEEQKLNEALFLYRYYKERMATDKNTDMLTLNRLMESFVEKNGWIKFTEDAGDLLDAAGFLKSLTGSQIEEQTSQQAEEEKASERRHAGDGAKSMELPPAEIELGGDPGAVDALEVLTATGMSIQETSRQQKLATLSPNDPLRMQAELIKATVEAAVAGMGNSPQQTILQPVMMAPIQSAALGAVNEAAAKAAVARSVAKEIDPAVDTSDEPTGEVEGFKGESVEFTSLIKRSDIPAEVLNAKAAATPAPPPADDATRVAPLDPAETEKTKAAPLASDKTVVEPLAAEAKATKDESDVEEDDEEQDDKPAAPDKKKLFNPLEHMTVTEESSSLHLEGNEDRTQMFSPIDVLDAVNVMKNREFNKIETKKIDLKKVTSEVKAAPVEAARAEISEGDKAKWRDLRVEGQPTQAFSPVEAVQAATDSRRPHESTVPPQAAPPPIQTPGPAPVSAPADGPAPAGLSSEALRESGDATMVMRPAEMAAQLAPREKTAPIPPPGELLAQPPATLVEHQTISLAEHTKTPIVTIDPNTPEAEGGIPSVTAAAPDGATGASASEGPAFMPIPAEVADKPGSAEDRVDLGDDLLEGPTRIFTQTSAGDKTEHLLKEIKHDLKNAAGDRRNIEILMKKADRFSAKRNYYLARKALRHAQALGADEQLVKTRLREIRKLEFPEGLYNTMSSDVPTSKVDTTEVLERLELEFDLTEVAGDSAELSAMVENKIEAILQENDPRTIIDFGVGLHEMALFRQAEALFIRVVEEYPEFAFDAYYLASVSKLSRRDYAGAASILKRLSTDSTKTDLEKIQIYYALGETFEKMRQRDRSRKFFEKVAELDANYRNIRHKLDE